MSYINETYLFSATQSKLSSIILVQNTFIHVKYPVFLDEKNELLITRDIKHHNARYKKSLSR